jgi:hypothetical protein
MLRIVRLMCFFIALGVIVIAGSKLFELGLPEVCIVCNIYAVAMTKNQIKKRSSRSNKEHPGCMGSILHLFDFPSGKKLLTDKTHGDGESCTVSMEWFVMFTSK